MKTPGKAVLVSTASLEAHVEELLRLPLQVRLVMAKSWKVRETLPENITATHRLIFLEKGELDYRVENTRLRLNAPGILYVPGWVRRGWKSAGSGAIRLNWVEFSSDVLDADFAAPFFRGGKIPKLETELMRDLRRIWLEKKSSVLRESILEHQTKTLLARFFEHCPGLNLPKVVDPGAVPADAEVLQVKDYLKAHFFEPGALQAAMSGVGISPDYFRRLFYRNTGQSMQAYITQLRMRKARFLLNGTTLRVKEVADQTGCRDPLRFSKMYREFWGYPPSAERKKKAARDALALK